MRLATVRQFDQGNDMKIHNKTPRRPQSLSWKATLTTRYARWVALFLKRTIRLHISVYNKQALITSGPVIFVGNHLSELDAVVWSAASKRNITMFAMSELWKNPFTGILLRLRGDIPVDRKDPAAGVAALNKGIDVLRHGGAIGLYPAGAINHIGQNKSWRKGFADMALKLARETGEGPTIVVIKLFGTADILPPKPDRQARGGKWVNRGAVATMICSDPISYETYAMMSPAQLTDYARKICDNLIQPGDI